MLPKRIINVPHNTSTQHGQANHTPFGLQKAKEEMLKDRAVCSFRVRRVKWKMMTFMRISMRYLNPPKSNRSLCVKSAVLAAMFFAERCTLPD